MRETRLPDRLPVRADGPRRWLCSEVASDDLRSPCYGRLGHALDDGAAERLERGERKQRIRLALDDSDVLEGESVLGAGDPVRQPVGID